MAGLSEDDVERIADSLCKKLSLVALDDKHMLPIWKSGANAMGAHAMDSLSLWVGRKVVHFFIAASVAAALAWAVFTKRP